MLVNQRKILMLVALNKKKKLKNIHNQFGERMPYTSTHTQSFSKYFYISISNIRDLLTLNKYFQYYNILIYFFIFTKRILSIKYLYKKIFIYFVEIKIQIVPIYFIKFTIYFKKYFWKYLIFSRRLV